MSGDHKKTRLHDGAPEGREQAQWPPDEQTPSAAEDRAQPLQQSGVLLALSGTEVGSRFNLGAETVLGRHSDATIQVTTEDVSRHHARITRGADGDYVVEDLESDNGTWVNGTRVLQQVLRFGDTLQLGATTAFLFTHSSPLEEQLLQEQRLESIGLLAGGVAHEFNNLMAAVLADLQYLREHLQQGMHTPDSALKTLGNAELAAHRVASLTLQLQGFARRGKLESRPVDLSRLVEDVRPLVARALGADITLRVEMPPNLVVLGDPALLHQALMNLCLNARDAMPEGGALSIRGSLVDLDEQQVSQLSPLKAGKHVLITVQDTGVGMDAETSGKIFEPFFTTKGPDLGTGLGLAAVHGVVKSHGGHIRVESEPGWGTSFQILLPAAKLVRADESEKRTVSVPAVQRTVLLVEDVDAERRGLAQLITQLGYRVLPVADGREAIRVFNDQRAFICLVVLDLVLPGLGGRDTFRWLRKIDGQVKVLLISGYVSAERAQDLILEGAVGFLTKPLEKETLSHAIAAATEEAAPAGR
jgi:signal transduction histidine kinase/ActR/RegA family two-component response regulator